MGVWGVLFVSEEPETRGMYVAIGGVVWEKRE